MKGDWLSFLLARPANPEVVTRYQFLRKTKKLRFASFLIPRWPSRRSLPDCAENIGLNDVSIKDDSSLFKSCGFSDVVDFKPGLYIFRFFLHSQFLRLAFSPSISKCALLPGRFLIAGIGCWLLSSLPNDLKVIATTRERSLVFLSFCWLQTLGFFPRCRRVCVQHGSFFEDHLPFKSDKYLTFSTQYSDLLDAFGIDNELVDFFPNFSVEFDPAAPSFYVAINSSYLCDGAVYRQSVEELCRNCRIVLCVHPADKEFLQSLEDADLEYRIGFGEVTKASEIYCDRSTVGDRLLFEGGITRTKFGDSSLLREEEVVRSGIGIYRN